MVNDKYLIIPERVYQSSLNSTEILVYGLVLSLSAKRGYCFARNSVIQKGLNISKQIVQRALKKLIEKNFIKKEIVEGKRHLKPLYNIKESNMTNKSIKNNTKTSIKNNTHNTINKDNKKDKFINVFSLNQKSEQKINNLLINSLEYLNKRHLKTYNYKIQISEQRHIYLVSNCFKEYLGDKVLKSINVFDDSFYKYIYCFYFDFKERIHKNNNRYYPYKFLNLSLGDFSYKLSKRKNEDFLFFKEELENNDSYDPEKNSTMHWARLYRNG